MPRNPVASKRYASSLFELALGGELGSVKPAQVLEELKVFLEALRMNSDVSKFFKSPRVSREEKKEFISDLEKSLPACYRFLRVLIDADRVDCLSEIIDEFSKQMEAEAGELSAKLELASDMGEESLNEVRSLIEQQWKKKPKLTVVKNPKLLGGFVVSAPGKVFDASLRSQLKRMQSFLSSN